jgi:hypothetical protein
MLERQVFVLRVWKDPHGQLRASIKSGADASVMYFADLELMVQFLKTRFQEPELQTGPRRQT